MRVRGIQAYRIRLWWLWLACSYRFRWAHRPLCSRFRSGVIRVGDIHLCRSCVCVYFGILLFVVLLALLRPSVAAAGIGLGGVGIPTLVLSGPWCYKNLPRVLRDVLRLAMGVMIALCGYLLLCRELVVALPATAVLFAFWRTYFTARRRRRLHACDDCPELSDKSVCSGCQLQADGVRRYEETATQLYLASGQTPNFSLSAERAERSVPGEGR
jgi:hypothetical protein